MVSVKHRLRIRPYVINASSVVTVLEKEIVSFQNLMIILVQVNRNRRLNSVFKSLVYLWIMYLYFNSGLCKFISAGEHTNLESKWMMFLFLFVCLFDCLFVCFFFYHLLSFHIIITDIKATIRVLRLIGSVMFGTIFNLVTRVGLAWFLEHWKTVVYKSKF